MRNQSANVFRSYLIINTLFSFVNICRLRKILTGDQTFRYSADESGVAVVVRQVGLETRRSAGTMPLL
jgi:hypothetical protein